MCSTASQSSRAGAAPARSRTHDAFCAHYDIPALEALSEQKQAIYTNGQKLYVQVLTLPQASARAGLGFAIFYVWFHFIEQAFIIRFMPLN